MGAAKDYLQELWDLGESVSRRCERLEVLRSAAERITPVYGGEAVQRSRNGEPVAGIVNRMIDMERELDADVKRLDAMRAEVWDTLEQLTDERCKTVLWLRFAERRSWSAIAVGVGYGRDYTRHELYHKGLRLLDNVLQKNTR